MKWVVVAVAERGLRCGPARLRLRAHSGLAATGISARQTGNGMRRSTRPGTGGTRLPNCPMLTRWLLAHLLMQVVGLRPAGKITYTSGWHWAANNRRILATPPILGRAVSPAVRTTFTRLALEPATSESVGTANVAGTNPHPARRDHVHEGSTGGGGPDLYDSIPPSIGEDGAIGVSDDASRGDHTHGGQRAVSDNTPEDVGTAAAGTHAAASRSDHVHGGGGGGGTGLSDDNPERIGDTLSPGTGTEASRDDHVHRPTFSTTTPSAVAVVGAIGGEEFPARADHAHSGAFLSDADPQDVAEDGESGDNSGSARSDHIHGLPIDNTLQFDGSDQLGVNIGDVVEHLQQNIRYYTSDSLDHSTGGSAAGQVYTTSRYPKNISRIKAEVRPDTPSVYKAGIYTVNSE